MQAFHSKRWRHAAGVTLFALASVACALAQAGQARSPAAAASTASAPDYPRLAEPDGMPTRTVWQQEETKRKSLAISAQATTTGTVSYNGGNGTMGVISGSPKVVLVFYGSQWGTASTNANGNTVFSNDPSGSAPYMQQMLKGLGTNGELWSGTFTQYCDGPSVATGATSCPSGAAHIGYPVGSVFYSAWYDNSAAAPAQATQQQLAAEAQKAASFFGLADPVIDRYTLYVIASPTGTHPGGFNTNEPDPFCAWHSNASTSYGSIQYINMPYVMDLGDECWAHTVNSGTAGALDGVSIVLGHEYAETLTDPIPISGWVNLPLQADGEVADECMPGGSSPGGDITMSTGTFAMQRTWSNDTNSCALTHPVALGGGQGALSVSPNPLRVTSGGGTVFGLVTVTNTGPGEVTNVRVTETGTSSTGGTMFLGLDGCSGANLGAGSSCTFKVDYRGLTCTNSSSTGTWTFSIAATGSINTVTLPAIGTSTPAGCRN